MDETGIKKRTGGAVHFERGSGFGLGRDLLWGEIRRAEDVETTVTKERAENTQTTVNRKRAVHAKATVVEKRAA